MRLSWTLLSTVWTTLTIRRYQFASGFASWKRLYYYQRTSHFTTSTTNMELNQTKRPQKEELNISPFEVKIGKVITTCPKCFGEGKIRAPLSKKERARRKQIKQNNTTKPEEESTSNNEKPIVPPPQMKLCRACDGSGLTASLLPCSESSQSSSPLSVAIVGGGIGGFALAAALQHRNIPCIVYERDTSFEERKQGYGLTMQQGARALRSLGFFSFTDNNDDTSQNNPNTTKFGFYSTKHIVHKPDGTEVGKWGMKVWGGRHEKGRQHAKRQNTHISRQNLRKILLDLLRPGTVKWGYKFLEYSEQGSAQTDKDSSQLNLTFQRRRSDCDLLVDEECGDELFTTSATVLVGCDGIRSVVRANKLGEDVAPLRYLGCIVILGIVESQVSPLTDGETVFQTADGTTRLYAMPFAQPGEEASSVIVNQDKQDRGLSMWQLSFPMEEKDAKQLSKLGPSALKTEALRRCGKWHHPIPDLLSQTQEELITGYPCYDRSIVDKEVFRNGCDDSSSSSGSSFVTMLGDAAHPMSPFKGQGANQALLDAVLLARKLSSVSRVNNNKKFKDNEHNINDRIRDALAMFEEEMLERASVKVLKSAEAAKFLHTEIAIQEGNITRGAAASNKERVSAITVNQ